MDNSIEPQLYLINKPAGVTSHDIVALIRSDIFYSSNERVKVGHTGTLDPFATGLLIILVGKAVKLQAQFMDSMKSYEACIQLGSSTDTGDLSGKIITTNIVPYIGLNTISEVLNSYSGKIVQPVPLYAAAKVNGKRLYEYARAGIEPPIRPIRVCTIYKISLLSYDRKLQQINIAVNCSSGTYIRSLAEMIANKLNTVGHLIRLNRTATGGFSLRGSASIKSILRAP